ncbi:hypothetical protein P7C70_g3891, partial [Phenoliferia sp. Uapishka_3]
MLALGKVSEASQDKESSAITANSKASGSELATRPAGPMVKASDYESGDSRFESWIFDAVSEGFSAMGPEALKGEMKKVNGIFEFKVKNAKGKEGVWTIDMKKEGKVYQGPAKPKADVIISLADETFQQVINRSLREWNHLADGSLNGQKAFMSGKLKVKGNIMLATKLDAVLKGAQKGAKL